MGKSEQKFGGQIDQTLVTNKPNTKQRIDRDGFIWKRINRRRMKKNKRFSRLSLTKDFVTKMF